MLFHSNDVIRRNTATYYKTRITTYTILLFFSAQICKKSFKISYKHRNKCLFGFLLLWVIIAINFSAHISCRWAFTLPTISLKLSARQTVLETVILLFSIFIDSARVTISSEISFGDLFKGRKYFNFVVLFLEKILISVQPYLESLSGKTPRNPSRNPSSSLDGGKSLTNFFLVFVHCFRKEV